MGHRVIKSEWQNYLLNVASWLYIGSALSILLDYWLLKNTTWLLGPLERQWGFLHLHKGFAQLQQHRWAVSVTNTNTGAEQNASQPYLASNTPLHFSVQPGPFPTRPRGSSVYFAYRKSSWTLLAFTLPDFCAVSFHSHAMVLFVWYIIMIFNVQCVNFCKGAPQSSSNPCPWMQLSRTSLSTNGDWQNCLLASWCLKSFLAGVVLNS